MMQNGGIFLKGKVYSLIDIGSTVMHETATRTYFCRKDYDGLLLKKHIAIVFSLYQVLSFQLSKDFLLQVL